MNREEIFNLVRKNHINYECLYDGLHTICGYNFMMISNNNINIMDNTDFVFFKDNYNIENLGNIIIPNNVIGINFSNNLKFSLNKLNSNNNIKYLGGVYSFGNLNKLPETLEILYLSPDFNDDFNKIIINNSLKKIHFSGKYNKNINNITLQNILLSYNYLDDSETIPSLLNKLELRYTDKSYIFPKNLNEVIYYIYDSEYCEYEDNRLNNKNRVELENLNNNILNNIKNSRFLNKDCKITEKFVY